MTMLAEAYLDDGERTRAMGAALGGMGLGVLLGYPFGGFLYDLSGSKMVPFVIIASAVLLDIGK